jgi:Fe-S-cluster containining protein
MECRIGCGACCIALSISSSIPGMPNGKSAGVRCAQLTPENLCAIYDSPDRPQACACLRPNEEMCGQNFEEAMVYLTALEIATRPDIIEKQ